MRLFLLVIAIIVGLTYGYEYALTLWIVSRIAVGVIINGAKASTSYRTDDGSYHSYQNSYDRSYRKDYQSNNANSGYKKTEPKSPECYYSVLGVSTNATDAEVKKAYRKLAMECHPDRFANSGEEIRNRANDKFREVNRAYEAVKELRQMK